ncbi:hypothetical protein [Streptomyces sp. NPDC047000]|uniref:hypothetical protein n=1 Tax=Streptomyces sp. NPDC047000 TaxID=3155474 RepID=UPI00340F89E4
MADYSQPDVVPKRVRFFDGQFLQDQDFVDEQKFHLDRERRQSRLLRLSGVSAGLAVSADRPFRIVVTAGMAVDPLGRHLVLAADTTVPLGEAFAGRQDIEVYLVHRETATDVAQTGGASERRWDESPKIVVIDPDGTTAVVPDGASPDLDSPVLLARLAVAGNGQAVADLTAASRISLSVDGALGVGTAAPVRDLEIGDFGPKDRHLTFKVAGGASFRSGIQLWAGAENEGYSLEYDQRPVAGRGLHVRTHGSTEPEGTTRLFVAPAGDIGIGTTAPANDGGWGRVVDVVGAGSSKLSVRTGSVEGGVLAHDGGVFGAAPGLVVGTVSASPLTLATGGAARVAVTAAGHVGIGSAGSPSSVTVTAEDNHLQLRRERIPADADSRYLFLELFQSDSKPPVYPATSFNIRFHHANAFWYRLEATANGFHFKKGDMTADDYGDIRAARVTASELNVGGVVVGEAELAVLKKLAAGELAVDIYSPRTGGYAYSADDHVTSSDPKRYVYSTGTASEDYRRWIIRTPR